MQKVLKNKEKVRKKGATEHSKNIKSPRNQGENEDLLLFYGLI